VQQGNRLVCGVAGSAILLEPQVFNIHTIQTRPQKIRNHIAVTFFIHCRDISILILEKVRPDHSIVTTEDRTKLAHSLCETLTILVMSFDNQSSLFRSKALHSN
jgi:hypothetical protein